MAREQENPTARTFSVIATSGRRDVYVVRMTVKTKSKSVVDTRKVQFSASKEQRMRFSGSERHKSGRRAGQDSLSVGRRKLRASDTIFTDGARRRYFRRIRCRQARLGQHSDGSAAMCSCSSRRWRVLL